MSSTTKDKKPQVQTMDGLRAAFGYGMPSIDDITGPLRPADWGDIADDYAAIASNPAEVLRLCRNYDEHGNVEIDAAQFARWTMRLGVEPDRHGKTPSNKEVVAEALRAIRQAGVEMTEDGLARHYVVITEARRRVKARRENEQRHAQALRAMTCHICSQVDATVTTRHGTERNNPAGGSLASARIDSVRSCDPCHALALVVIAEQQGRRKAVEAWVAAQGE